VSEFRSGFAAIVGRPNVGKSTLANALVGQKVAITSSKPETTRGAIRAIIQRDDAQVVLVDTPGLHRPRTELGSRLNDMVHGALADVDAVVVALPADQKIGPGDRFLLGAVPKGLATVVVVTKVDKVSPTGLVEKLTEVDAAVSPAVGANRPPAKARPAGSGSGPQKKPDETLRGRCAGIVPVSAVKGSGLEELASVLTGLMPLGPKWYPEDQVTDQDLAVRLAELVREAGLEAMRDELPHSIAVLVEEIERPEGPGVTRVRASLFVERDSQKGIVIGHRGSRLKAIGSAARPGIEALIGGKVFLEIHVKVAKDWQRDPKALRRLGF